MAQIALKNVDRKDRNEWRKHFALLFNNAAGGANSQAILAVWYAWITRESGATIYGNNPLNLTCGKGDGCYTGQVGWYNFAGNSRKFAAFATPQDGANAVVALLTNHPEYRYPAIIKAAKKDDWQGMVDAIILSCWVSCSHPGYGGLNGTFYATVNQQLVNVAKDVADGTIGKIPAGATTGKGTPYAGPTLASLLGRDFKLDSPATIITAIAELLAKYPAIATSGPDGNAASLQVYIIDFIGHNASEVPLNLPGAPGYDSTVNVDAGAPHTDDPLTAISKALGALVGFVGQLFNPETWLRTGSLLLGFILAITGFKMLMDATSGSPSSA